MGMAALSAHESSPRIAAGPPGAEAGRSVPRAAPAAADARWRRKTSSWTSVITDQSNLGHHPGDGRAAREHPVEAGHEAVGVGWRSPGP